MPPRHLLPGALYHQFADKTELFQAVYEAIEEDLVRHLDERVVAAGVSDPIEAMKLGANAWLDACGEQELVGAFDEAGLYIARADDQAAASEEMRTVIAALVAGLAER